MNGTITRKASRGKQGQLMGETVKATTDEKLSELQQQILEFVVNAYYHVLAYDQPTRFEDWADKIAQVYSSEQPHNQFVITFLKQ